MLTNLAKLTKTEDTVFRLNAVGNSYKEIADILSRIKKEDVSTETVKSHMRNIKIKKGLQKASELTALYWCESFGVSYEDRKRQMLSSMLTLILLFSFQVDFSDRYRRPEQRRSSRIEIRASIRRIENAYAA